MKNYITIACLFLVTGLFGQNNGYPPGEFYDIMRERNQHFEELLLTEDEEEFYREGGAYSEYRKWLRLWEPRLAGHGDFDFYYKVIKTYMDNNFVDGNSYKSNDDPWVELGPKRRRNNMIGIGPIEFITFYEPDPGNMLCGGLEGGLFYSTDEGNSWNNSGSDLQWPYSGCKHAVFYPDDSEKWFAASSQSHGADGASGAFSGSSYDKFIQSSPIHFTGGVFRTTDAGANWDKILDIWDLYPDFDPDAGDPVPDLALHALLFDKKINFQSEHDLFASTSHGLWRAQDPLGLGQEWEKMPIDPPVAFGSLYPDFLFSDIVHIHDLEYLPATNSSTLCAAVRFEGTNTNDNSKLYVWRLMLSIDNGETWAEISSQPAHDPDNNLYSIETSQAAPNSFFCLLDKHNDDNATVQEYNVLNDTWILRAQDFSNDYGSGHAFGIDQSDPSFVFVSNGIGLRWFYGQQSVAGVDNGHPDVEDIVSHPDVVNHPNEIWVSNHGGVKKITLDPITHQSSFVDRSDGLGVAEVTSLASSKSIPDFVVAGLFHDYSVITRTPYDHTSDWDPDWENIGPSRDGTQCMVSAYDPDIAYTSGHVNFWKRSYNTTISSNSQSINIGDSKTWWSVGGIDRNDHNLLYRATAANRGTSQYTDENGNTQTHTNREIEIFRSFNGGLSSNEFISRFGEHDPNNNIFINDTICRYATGTSKRESEMFNMIKVSPVNSDHLYITYRNWDWRKHLHRNRQAKHPDVETVKSNWQWLPTPGKQHNWINGVAFDHEDENIVYVARSSSNAVGPNPENDEYGTNMVFRMDYSDLSNYPASITTEFNCTNGEPCQDITMNLPNTFLSIDALESEKGSDGGLYIGTSFGVYYTNNKRIASYDPNIPDKPNSGWLRLGGGFPHVLNTGLEINYVINRIRVGTYGRGVWEHGLSCPPDPADRTETSSYIQDEYIEVTNDITSIAEVPVGLDVKYRGGNTISLEPGFHAKAGSDFHAFIHPCDKVGNSFSYRSFNEEADGSDPIQGSSKPDLLVYPNPTMGSFTIVVSDQEFKMNEPGSLQIYDLFGKIVHSTIMAKNNKRIDLQGFSGVYLVEFISGSTKLHTKIVLH